MSDQMPEWPAKPIRGEGSASVSFEHVAAVQAIWLTYNEAMAEAALARMDALTGYVRHAPSCAIGCTVGGLPAMCDCGLSELLAACEREQP